MEKLPKPVRKHVDDKLEDKERRKYPLEDQQVLPRHALWIRLCLLVGVESKRLASLTFSFNMIVSVIMNSPDLAVSARGRKGQERNQTWASNMAAT